MFFEPAIAGLSPVIPNRTIIAAIFHIDFIFSFTPLPGKGDTIIAYSALNLVCTTLTER